MKNFKGEIIIRPSRMGENATEEIGEFIHNQLIGNMDYVMSRIGIKVSADEVFIWIDDCEGDVPDITI